VATKKLDGSLGKKIRGALSPDLKLPQAAEVLSHFIHEAGGPRSLGKLLYQEYKDAKPGTSTRQRLLEMVMRLLSSANALHGSRLSAEELEDSDLARELTELMTGIPDEAVAHIPDEAEVNGEEESKA